MAEYRGVVRAAGDYLGEAAVHTAVYTSVFAVVTVFIVLPLVVSGTGYGAFAVFSLLGMSAYFAHVDMDDGADRVYERDEPQYIKHAMTALIFVYHNVMVLFATALGISFEAAWPGLGLAVAAVYPAVDGELTRAGWPITLTGLLSVCIAVLAKLAVAIELTREYGEDLEDVLEVLESYGIQEELAMRVEQSKRGWI